MEMPVKAMEGGGLFDQTFEVALFPARRDSRLMRMGEYLATSAAEVMLCFIEAMVCNRDLRAKAFVVVSNKYHWTYVEVPRVNGYM